MILDGAQDPDSAGYVEGFTGDGFISLAIIYAVSAVFNWFAPSVMVVLGTQLIGLNHEGKNRHNFIGYCLIVYRQNVLKE